MKCCFCGTLKNCDKYLDKIFENIYLKLKEYQLKNLKLELYVNKDKMFPYRTWNISKGRNYCINTIKNKYSDYDYFIVMDMDDVCARNVKIDVIEQYLNRNDEWDSLSFNHPYGYYDLWALSKRPLVFSCWHYKNGHELYSNYIRKLISKCNPNQLIPCLSAFNGFAIYKTNKFINCKYDGRFRHDYIPKKMMIRNRLFAGKIMKTPILNDRNQDCEHRHFHFNAIRMNGAKIRISPKCIFE